MHPDVNCLKKHWILFDQLSIGLAYRVIADAAHLTCERSLFPEHAALASIRSDLVVAPLYFKSSDMAWIGGSVFATDKVK